MIEVDLDLDVLEELSSLESVRPGLLATLIDKFESNRMAQLGELELARALGDAERARSLLHSLKGAAATLGLAGLARHVARLEQAPEQVLNDANANETLRVLTAQSLQVLKRWAASHQS